MANQSSSKQLIYGFVMAYAVVFIALAALGYYCMPKTGPRIDVAKQQAQIVVTDLAYYELPPVIVSVNAKGRPEMSPRVRVDLALEVERKDMAVVEGYQPYISERVGTLLRALSPEQIESTRNISWIRAEMLRAINNAGTPAPVHGVLFRRLVVM